MRRKLLCSCLELEDLTVNGGDKCMENPREFSFKLKKFRFQLCAYPLSASENLFFFLEAQSLNLEFLEIQFELNQASYELILNGMPRLTTLATDINQVEEVVSYWSEPFPVNILVTIISLHLTVALVFHQQIPLETVIRALPNLKHLEINDFNDEVLFFLAVAAPTLELLKVLHFRVSHFPETNIFPNIKKFKVEDFCQDSQEPFSNGTFAELVKKEMRNHRELRLILCK